MRDRAVRHADAWVVRAVVEDAEDQDCKEEVVINGETEGGWVGLRAEMVGVNDYGGKEA